jgi:RNA polymerase sigma-70 factor (ECF subfamily)
VAEPSETKGEGRDPEPVSDALVAGFCAGEVGATREIQAWVRRAAAGFRQPLAGDWDDAVQESLLKLWSALREGRFAGRGNLAAYVKRVVSNVCLDRLRTRRTWKWLGLEALALPSPTRSALERVERQEQAALLLDVLAAMPAECRDLWQMILDGLSYREMSQRLGAGEGALRVRVLRCRRQATELRRKLAARAAE